MLSSILRSSRSPAYFIENFLKIHNPCSGLVPFKLHPHQHTILSYYYTNSHVICESPRQSGKSSISLSYLLWKCLYERDHRILLCGVHLDNVRLMLRFIEDLYNSMDEIFKDGIKIGSDYIEFSNGNIIHGVVMSESFRVRGLTVSLVYMDEFAFVLKAREFWESIYPCVNHTGESIITSTRSSDEHLFSEIFSSAEMGKNIYRSLRV